MDADDRVAKELYKYTFKGEWEKVMELYRTEPSVHLMSITSSNDTALHMAINDDRSDVVAELIRILKEKKQKDALEMQNDRGETPLHRAAVRGSVRMCECIVVAGDKAVLLTQTNNREETPIFMAALNDRKDAFLYLQDTADLANVSVSLRRKIEGDTILHCAIKRDHLDLAFHIMKRCPDLLSRVNEKGMTPLHVLASKPSSFRSGNHLSWWMTIIYLCIHVDPLKYDPIPRRPHPKGPKEENWPVNYNTCVEFFTISWLPEDEEKKGNEEKNSSYYEHIPQNYAVCYEFLTSVCINLFGVIGFGKTFTDIVSTKQKHTWSVQILDELLENPSNSYISEGSKPGFMSDSDVFNFNAVDASVPTPTQIHQDEGQMEKVVSQGESRIVLYNMIMKDGDTDWANWTKLSGKGKMEKVVGKEKNGNDTALLVAAKYGVQEVVNKILDRLPMSIHETSSMEKNILMVAVENRQPRIFRALWEHFQALEKNNLWKDLIQAVDSEDNTILHLAARTSGSDNRPWQIPGSAMQMQWEIKWYEYVKDYLPSHFLFLTNQKDQTPGQIFTETHEKMTKDSGDWLKDTSESCSVVAALVAGVSFATSSSVPGGNNDQTGKPNLEGYPAFNIFAITALIGLCFSVTALVMFLSILTSRKQPKDFRRNLPLKLLLGLSSLFVSIASMLISFCAAHFFVLEDKFKKVVFPLYAATCLPVSFYAVAQFPLYLDLLKSVVLKIPQSNYYGSL